MPNIKIRNEDGDAVFKYFKGVGAMTDDDPFVPIYATSSTGTQKTLLHQILSTNGDGTGTISAIGNYASAATEFYIQPAAGVVYRIARMIPHVVDAGSFDAGSYGNGITLTNGVLVQQKHDAVIDVNLTPLAILTNVDWGRYCFDIKVSTFGLGNESLGARWTFAKYGQYIRLVGDNNDRFTVILNDDFTDLVDQTFVVEGYIE